MRMRGSLRRACVGAAGALAAVAAGAGTPPPELAVQPLARDQVLAFYGARGFDASALAAYADACVLSFTLRNAGRQTLRHRLADWTAGDGVRFRPLAAWDAEWEKRGVPPPARIAFRWAQFPEEQEFAPGDWIMGMAALERRIVGPFRVVARYADEKGEHEIATAAVACAD